MALWPGVCGPPPSFCGMPRGLSAALLAGHSAGGSWCGSYPDSSRSRPLHHSEAAGETSELARCPRPAACVRRPGIRTIRGRRYRASPLGWPGAPAVSPSRLAFLFQGGKGQPWTDRVIVLPVIFRGTFAAFDVSKIRSFSTPVKASAKL